MWRKQVWLDESPAYSGCGAVWAFMMWCAGSVHSLYLYNKGMYFFGLFLTSKLCYWSTKTDMGIPPIPLLHPSHPNLHIFGTLAISHQAWRRFSLTLSHWIALDEAILPIYGSIPFCKVVPDLFTFFSQCYHFSISKGWGPSFPVLRGTICQCYFDFFCSLMPRKWCFMCCLPPAFIICMADDGVYLPFQICG